jgi:hypothetical protein
MQKFTPIGKIEKVHEALAVQVDGWKLGVLIIGAREVQDLLAGHTVEVNFVQQRPGRDPFIGYAGVAQLSRSGRAVNVRLEGKMMTAPLREVQAVAEGKKAAARLSSPASVIDADTARPIGAGLIRGGF